MASLDWTPQPYLSALLSSPGGMAENSPDHFAARGRRRCCNGPIHAHRRILLIHSPTIMEFWALSLGCLWRCEDDTTGSFRSPLVLQFRFKDLGYLWAMLIPIASRKEPQKEEKETNPARNSHCNLPSLSLSFPNCGEGKGTEKKFHSRFHICSRSWKKIYFPTHLVEG